ncbi:hypothetical protein VINE108274_11350 [Vibrio neptunius]
MENGCGSGLCYGKLENARKARKARKADTTSTLYVNKCHPQEGGTTELGISQSKLREHRDSLLPPSSVYGMTVYLLEAFHSRFRTPCFVLSRRAEPVLASRSEAIHRAQPVPNSFAVSSSLDRVLALKLPYFHYVQAHSQSLEPLAVQQYELHGYSRF